MIVNLERNEIMEDVMVEMNDIAIEPEDVDEATESFEFDGQKGLAIAGGAAAAAMQSDFGGVCKPAFSKLRYGIGNIYVRKSVHGGKGISKYSRNRIRHRDRGY